MSEKLEGAGGYWDGERLMSRNGLPFSPPPEFTFDLPDFALEGVIWAGRGDLARAVSTTRRGENDDWLALQFVVLDVPSSPGDYLERLRKARDWFTDHPSRYAFVIDNSPVRSRANLDRQLQRVEAQGGDGLILHRPDAPYIAGASRDVLKVRSYETAEAMVLDYKTGTGGKEDRIGSILVELPDSGLQFKIGNGFSDDERHNPPPIGSLVTIKYSGFYDSGIPRYPVFLGAGEGE